MRSLASITVARRASRGFASRGTRRLVLLLALATASACGSDSSTSPTTDAIEGTYSLRTVNGSPLPFTVVQSGTNSFVLTSDVITIASNGSWTESIQYRETVNGQTTNGTDADGGTWVRSGGNVSLKSNLSGDIAYSGAFSGGSLTFNASGFVAVFSR